MPAQFAHLETYSRKASKRGAGTGFIFAEARRCPEASLHVASPQAPKVVYGLAIDDVEKLHDRAACSARLTIKDGRKRRLRQDHKTLVAIVLSHPHKMAAARLSEQMRLDLLEFERLSLGWLRGKYGADLLSVVRHVDEANFHLHAFVVPLSDPELRALRYHPGVATKAFVLEEGRRCSEELVTLKKRGDRAYREAMRAWQDDFHKCVGAYCGLTRFGPKRRRLSREEWHLEQKQMQALRYVRERAEKLQRNALAKVDLLKANERELEQRKSQLLRDLQSLQAQFAHQQTQLASQGAELQALSQSLDQKAARHQSLGGSVRNVIDGFKSSKIESDIRAAVAEEVDLLKQKVQAAHCQIEHYKSLLLKEKVLSANLKNSCAELSSEKARLIEELSSLRPAGVNGYGVRSAKGMVAVGC